MSFNSIISMFGSTFDYLNCPINFEGIVLHISFYPGRRIPVPKPRRLYGASEHREDLVQLALNACREDLVSMGTKCSLQ